MKVEREKIFNLLFVIMSVLLLPQCVTEPEPVPPSQTRILAVKVEPNPVMIGDTATFTCIIEDSLSKRFTYIWSLDKRPSEKTKQNYLVWVAPSDTGTIYNTVYADNGSKDSVAPRYTFSVSVTN